MFGAGQSARRTGNFAGLARDRATPAEKSPIAPPKVRPCRERREATVGETKEGAVRVGGPERRFMERMAFCGPKIVSAQEVSMPRKARSLDLVMRFDAAAPVWFGALREVCTGGVVRASVAGGST
jgi:hypothetical protein